MGSLTGEFNNTLDEKGRISLPSRLRSALAGSALIITQGADACLWLYPPGEWDRISRVILNNTNPFSASSRIIRRRIIGPAQEVEIDRVGRLAIPQSLREFAGLSKDCVFLGQYEYIELWDAEIYKAGKAGSDNEFRAASEELGGRLRENDA